MNRVNSHYPKGDKGGNSFPLKYHYKVDELHGLWDSVMYEYRSDVKRVTY